MKRAVSISIGSSRRDKKVDITLLGEKVCLERIGTDGDMEAAAELFRDLDGKVDAFGVGGADLGLLIDGHWYPLHSVSPLIRHVRKTPVVDGHGLKLTHERRIADFLERRIKPWLDKHGRRLFMTAGVDRWGMVRSFADWNYEAVYGDLFLTLGIPIPLRSVDGLKRLASFLVPVVARLPFKWVYPVGESQEKRTPKAVEYFANATVIAGDCHYITRYMPDELPGKVIVTNTTTEADVELLKRAGVKYLVTSTPVLEGRSFGTNMMEAALVAASGRVKPVDYRNASEYFKEIEGYLKQIKLEPQLRELN
ncbi:MAG: hypothetical protein JXR32_05575 [Anaerolineaceae bacterium]|nr:hypothetical protein [Anaerolineaceae bacterium]